MALWKATVELLLEADSEDEVHDAVSETLRPLTGQGYAFLDWQYLDWRENALNSEPTNPVPTTGEEFAEYWEYRND
jgi:hypothetical protein